MPGDVAMVYGAFALGSGLVFRWAQPPVAILIVVLGGWLLLPVGTYPEVAADVRFPWWISGVALPTDILLSKAWIAPVVALFWALLVDAGRLQFRRSGAPRDMGLHRACRCRACLGGAGTAGAASWRARPRDAVVLATGTGAVASDHGAGARDRCGGAALQRVSARGKLGTRHRSRSAPAGGNARRWDRLVSLAGRAGYQGFGADRGAVGRQRAMGLVASCRDATMGAVAGAGRAIRARRCWPCHDDAARSVPVATAPASPCLRLFHHGIGGAARHYHRACGG